MIHRLVIILVLLPLAVLLIALTVANRHTVAFTFDPFNPGNGALTFYAPLFVYLYLSLLAGLIVGSLATWIAQRKYRRQARRFGRSISAGENDKKNERHATDGKSLRAM